MRVLFKTLHGSRLYGLAHEHSDEDFYVVVDKIKTNKARYARQQITGGQDTTVVDFGTWLNMCVSGVPQAVEAMFSQQPLIDTIGAFRSGYRVSTGASERYLRTITNFCMTQDPKRKRHGLRLALNMADFTRAGRFNPRLTSNEVDFVTEQSKKDCDSVYAIAMNIALDRYPPGMLR